MKVRFLGLLIMAGMFLAACGENVTPGLPVVQPTLQVTRAPAQPTTLPADQPGITINPNSARAGTVITVKGTNFPAGQMIRFFVGPRSIGAAGEPYEGVQVAADGTFTGKLIAPAGWPGGAPITDPALVVVAANDDLSVQASADFTLTLETSSMPGPALAARQLLAEQLQLAPDAITIVSVEQVQWRDGCLEVRTPGRMCTQVITPGYRVVLDAHGTRYEYHTDMTGVNIQLASGK